MLSLFSLFLNNSKESFFFFNSKIQKENNFTDNYEIFISSTFNFLTFNSNYLLMFCYSYLFFIIFFIIFMFFYFIIFIFFHYYFITLKSAIIFYLFFIFDNIKKLKFKKLFLFLKKDNLRKINVLILFNFFYNLKNNMISLNLNNFSGSWIYKTNKFKNNNPTLFSFFSVSSLNKLLKLIIFNLHNFQLFFFNVYRQSIGDGFFYIRGLLLIVFIDACLTDDEPIWEPVEWSLIQTWLFFIFIFSWIAENLISSRYGSYTGRDKRVWYAWYKTYWGLELAFSFSLGAAALFVIVPFYYEITYNIAFVFSWWNWFSRVFFFKFISIYVIILLFSYLFLISIKWLNWKKLFVFALFINFFILYFLYTQFIISFFGYFTDPIWYQKTRYVDYIQLSHEPLKWGFGPAKRDHFAYHKVTTIFWFKNDGPFASAMLLINLMMFLSTFLLYFWWLILLRRIYSTEEVSYTYATYCVSSLKQFFYMFLFLYIFIFISLIIAYWRYPIEFNWISNNYSWFINFSKIVKDYPNFIFKIFFK